jgi:MFS family permease
MPKKPFLYPFTETHFALTTPDKTPMENKVNRSLVYSCCLGNFFEHYDTALFGFLSPFLAPRIFPAYDSVTALILTYAIIPLGMLARPIGALFFGFIGDTLGRLQALFISLVGMAIISVAIAFVPIYHEASFLTPFFFSLARIIQNFFAAGEVMGGAIFLLEHTPKSKHDLLSAIFSASTIGGILLASFGVALSVPYAEGWRCLYLAGSLTALFGSFLRWQMAKTKGPENIVTERYSFSLKQQIRGFWLYRKAFFYIAIGAAFSYANYSMALVLINGFVPLISNISAAEMVQLNTALLVLDFCTLPFFGWLASRISREKVMLYSALAAILLSTPLFLLLDQASMPLVIAVRVCLVCIGVAFAAPLHAWAQDLVPKKYRYATISLSYALGSQLLGGPTAAFSLWIYKQTGMVASITWYWIFIAFCAAIAITAAMGWSRLKTQDAA